MGKSSKGSSTIRRRKQKIGHDDMEKARQIVNEQSAEHGDMPIKDPSTDMTDNSFDDDFDSGSDVAEIDPVAGSGTVHSLFLSEQKLFLGLLALRIMNALMVQTSYVPDEYWQSLEVAHKMVFGYGFLTWEWREGLRGAFYPTIFAFLYKILAVFHMDYRILLIKLPRVLQGVMSAYGDIFLYKLSMRLSNPVVARWTLTCHVISWFTLYCATRTLSNTTEAALTTMALYYYPWPGKPRFGSCKFLCLAALSVIVRPTAAVTWILMCSWHLQSNRTRTPGVLRTYVLVSVSALGLSLFIDRLFYGHWVCVQYNFLKFNVLSNAGTFYGSHPWHWYITQGYPVIMATHLIPFAYGVYMARNKVLAWLVMWTIAVYSCLGHKEFRFIYTTLPLSMHYCGLGLHALSLKLSALSLVTTKSTISSTNNAEKKNDSPSTVQCSSNSPVSSTYARNPQLSKRNQKNKTEHATRKQTVISSVSKVLMMTMIAANVSVALYFSLIHQRGTVIVMNHLRTLSYRDEEIKVLFLMPCHSTPYYSYIHRNMSMRFLTCEPNLGNVVNYIDEADIFYQSPSTWLTHEFQKSSSTLPTHVVYFDTLQSDIETFLKTYKYTVHEMFFHTHLPEGRVGQYVIVSSQESGIS